MPLREASSEQVLPLPPRLRQGVKPRHGPLPCCLSDDASHGWLLRVETQAVGGGWRHTTAAAVKAASS